MLQRNVSGETLILPTLTPPVQVFDGETLDHDTLIAGFEPVTDSPADTALAIDDLVDLGPIPPAALVGLSVGGATSFIS